MEEANFPLYCRQHARRRRRAVPGFKDRTDLRRRRHPDRTDRRRADRNAAQLSNPGDVKFSPLVAAMQEQCKALRARRRRFRGDGRACRRATRTMACSSSRAADLILSGHDHDLCIDYDGRTASVESSPRRAFCHRASISPSPLDTRRRPPRDHLVSAIPPDRHRQCRARSGRAGRGARTTRAKLVEGIRRRRSPRTRSRSTAAPPPCAPARRRSAILLPTRSATTTGSDIAIINGGGIRGDKSIRPAAPITRRDVMPELLFRNHVARAGDSGQSVARGPGERLQPVAAHRRALSASVRPDFRGGSVATGRDNACSGQGRQRAARRQRKSIKSRPTISWRAAMTAMPASRMAKKSCPTLTAR